MSSAVYVFAALLLKVKSKSQLGRAAAVYFPGSHDTKGAINWQCQ